MKQVVKDECEKGLSKMKKEKKANCISKKNLETAKKRREAKTKKDKSQKELNKEFPRAATAVQKAILKQHLQSH